MSIFSSWLASPPPDAAVEIAPERISAATVGSRGSRPVVTSYASQPLPAGAVVASLTSPNILDRRLVVETLREVIGSLGSRPKKVALVIPDSAAKVSLLHFEQVPARRDDLDQLVRWQIRKSAPFPIEDASVTYTAGARVASGGSEYIVELARHDIVRDYETVCGNAGVYAGLVDTATMSVINLFLASRQPPTGDWLLVHMRPSYTSLAIVRDGELIFFRNRPEGEGDSLADLVHQTAMYYQDRLNGKGFSRVLLGGRGEAGQEEFARRNLQERLGVTVDEIDPAEAAPLSGKLKAGTDAAEMLAPLVGILLRTQREAMTA